MTGSGRTIAAMLLATLAAACDAAETKPATFTEAPTAPAAFACGPTLTCNPETQYCSVTRGGPVGVPPAYQCTDLPAECRSKPSCGCLTVPIGCSCGESNGGVTVTCTAP